MAEKPSSKDILAFRADCEENGLDHSKLTDEQVARQIMILRGGFHRPTRQELREIRARSEKTKALFERNEREVLGLFRDALNDIRLLHSKGSSRSGESRDGKGSVAFFRRLDKLQTALVAYPPSLLRPVLREALREISSWTSAEGSGRKGTRPSRVTSMLEGWLRSGTIAPE